MSMISIPYPLNIDARCPFSVPYGKKMPILSDYGHVCSIFTVRMGYRIFPMKSTIKRFKVYCQSIIKKKIVNNIHIEADNGTTVTGSSIIKQKGSGDQF